jgi:hypothetical protein
MRLPIVLALVALSVPAIAQQPPLKNMKADPTLKPTSSLSFKPGGDPLGARRFVNATPIYSTEFPAFLSVLGLWGRPKPQVCIDKCAADKACVAWTTYPSHPWSAVESKMAIMCELFHTVPPYVSGLVWNSANSKPFECKEAGDEHVSECLVGVFTERVVHAPKAPMKLPPPK